MYSNLKCSQHTTVCLFKGEGKKRVSSGGLGSMVGLKGLSLELHLQVFLRPSPLRERGISASCLDSKLVTLKNLWWKSVSDLTWTSQLGKVFYTVIWERVENCMRACLVVDVCSYPHVWSAGSEQSQVAKSSWSRTCFYNSRLLVGENFDMFWWHLSSK